MEHKEAIIQAAIALIQEKGERIEEVTVREICKRANVGLGLVNYYFESREKLLELCIEKIIGGIVENFQKIRETTSEETPIEKLKALGNLTFTFLFEHFAVSKISILSDMRAPREGDNTSHTYASYLPLVAACRPDWDEAKVKQKTFCLISLMQQVFLRHEFLLRTQGVDLKDPIQRASFYVQLLTDVLEIAS